MAGRKARGAAGRAAVWSQPAHSSRTYTTNFPSTENQLSEGGNWVNGGTVGLDWTNCSSAAGRVIGHQTGPSFSDATALVTGPWASNQQATATVFADGVQDEVCCHEVELRVRSALSAHSNTGYEFSWKVSQTGYAYLIIVRWNGAFGNYTILFQSTNAAQWGVTDGDVVHGTVIGNVLTAYKNGAQQAQATDNTWTTGSPGIGFNLENAAGSCPGTSIDYGFTNFTARDL